MEKWIERGARRAEKNRSDKKRELGISEEKKLRRQRIDDIIKSIYYLGVAGFCIYLIISIIFKYGIKDAVLAIIASSCFTIWLLIDGMKPFLHLIAKRKDWTRLASWSASEADKDEEIKHKREQKMAHHHSDGTIILATESGDIRELLDTYAFEYSKNHIDNIAQLWQIEGDRYAITFPCGVARIPLMNLLFELYDECSEFRLWIPSYTTKRTTGVWTMATVNSDYFIVAASDDGRQWIVPEEDEEQFLFKETDTHQIDFQPYPDIFLSTDRKRELFY